MDSFCLYKFFVLLGCCQYLFCLMSLYPQKASPSLFCKIASQLCNNTCWIFYRNVEFCQERASAGQGGLINVQAPSGLCPCLQGLMQCPEEVRSSKAGKGLRTSSLAFWFPEQNVCQAAFHLRGNCTFVQTCQYGEGCYLNCIQSLHKRLSMRSCNYSGVLIMP